MRLFLKILGVFIFTLGLLSWAQITLSYSTKASDFTHDYAAAYSLQKGLPIYGDHIKKLASEWVSIESDTNYHPPTNAVFYLPLSYLPYSVSFWLWNTLNLLLYVWMIQFLISILSLKQYSFVSLWPILLFWFPFLTVIELGQFSVILAAGVTGGWGLLKANKQTAAGTLLGFLTLLKLYPGLLFLFLILKKKNIAAKSMAATILIGFLITLWFVGTDQCLHYLQYVLTSNSEVWSPFPINASLWGFFLSLFSENTWVAPAIELPFLRVFLLSICVGVITLASWRTHLSRESELDTSYTFFVLTMLWVSPITWLHSLVVLLFPLSLLIEKRSAFIPLMALCFLSIPDIKILRSLTTHYSPEKIPWEDSFLLRSAFFGLTFLWGVYYIKLGEIFKNLKVK